MSKIFSKKNIFILLTALTLISFSLGLFLPGFNAKANANGFSNPLLPTKTLEYDKLSGVGDSAFFAENYAIIANQEVIVYDQSSQKTAINGFTDVKQVKFLDQNTLLVSDNGSVYLVDIATQNKIRVVGGNFFDFNQSYLVTVFNVNIQVYKIADVKAKLTAPTSAEPAPYITISGANGNFAIAINQNNEIFYHSANDLHREIIGSNKPTRVPGKTSTAMIANDKYLYFIYNNQVNALDLADDSVTPLTVSGEFTDYELGNIPSPVYLSFKNENILVTDAYLNAVQEFAVTDGILEFTGFAIASEKTAYNRIAKNALDIETFKDTVAILDQNKLTVIDQSEGFDGYAKDRFINLYLGNAPARFALGNGTLLIENQNQLTLITNLFDKAKRAEVSVDGITQTVKDLCYQSGYYYALTTDGAKSSIYKFSQDQADGAVTPLLIKEVFGVMDLLWVDVFGNVYFADQLKIYQNDMVSETKPRSNVTKLITDLAGEAFAVTDGSVNYFDTQLGDWKPLDDGGLNVKSFAFNYDKNEVFFNATDSEYLYQSLKVGNLSIQSFEVPSDFLSLKESAFTDIDGLEFYTANPAQNVYSATYTNARFTFDKLAELQDEYLKLGEYTLQTVNGTDFTLLALASQDQITLINKDHAVKANKQISASPFGRVYSTTNVSLYQLPIITAKDLFVRETDQGEKVKLAKNCELLVTKKFNFLGLDYYSAAAEINGVTVAGFIPCSFTVDVLTQDVIADKYTVTKVNAVSVYQAPDLTGEVATLDKNTRIRVYSQSEGVLYIAYLDNNVFKYGYIDAKFINNDEQLAVRNILIILAVITSICGTTTYFVLRKRSI